MISVVICTHNPDTPRLARVLEALRMQTLSPAAWDLLIIDNASAPAVVPAADWHPRARIVREPQLGLTSARLRGIAEAVGDVLVFVDDDNLLAPDYLAEVQKIAAAWPILGAWGGRIDPEFATPPAEWTREFWHLLALAPITAARWSNSGSGSNHALPPGAGQCVRSTVARHYATLVQAHPLRGQLDRVGGALSSCGDLDLALTATDLGLGTGQFPALRLTHIIPPGRLEHDYLLRLVEGVGYSTYILNYLRGEHPGRRPQSRARTLFERWDRSRLAPRERAVAEAYERARIRALATIASMENSSQAIQLKASAPANAP